MGSSLFSLCSSVNKRENMGNILNQDGQLVLSLQKNIYSLGQRRVTDMPGTFLSFIDTPPFSLMGTRSGFHCCALLVYHQCTASAESRKEVAI